MFCFQTDPRWPAFSGLRGKSSINFSHGSRILFAPAITIDWTNVDFLDPATNISIIVWFFPPIVQWLRWPGIRGFALDQTWDAIASAASKLCAPQRKIPCSAGSKYNIVARSKATAGSCSWMRIPKIHCFVMLTKLIKTRECKIKSGKVFVAIKLRNIV